MFDESKIGYQPQNQKSHSENSDQQDITQVEVESGVTNGLKTEYKKDEFDDQNAGDQSTETESYMLVRDRKRRAVHLPLRYGHADLISYAFNVAEDIKHKDPMNFKAAMRRNDRKLSITAMQEEMSSLNNNQAWILVNKPKNQRVVGCKWIFKKKESFPSIEREMY